MSLPAATTTFRLARRFAGNALLLAAFGLAAVMLVPALFGYERYVVTGASMTGSIDRGSIVFDEVVPADALRKGDVITFVPPAPWGQAGNRVTHRITGLREIRGETVMRTRGDANAAADPWRMVLDQSQQARVAFHVPYVGYALSALSIKKVRMLVIGLPAALIALFIVGGLVRDIRRERVAPVAEVAS